MTEQKTRGRPVNPDIREQRTAGILNAALKVLGRNGLHNTTMKDICTAASISPGALYHYFASKDDIILAIAELEARETDLLIAALDSSAGLSTALNEILNSVIEFLTDPVTARLTVDLSAEALRNPQVDEAFRGSDDRLRVALQRAIMRDRQHTQVAPGQSPEAAAYLIMALFDGIAIRAAFGEVPPKAHMIAELRALLKMLRP